MYVCMWFIGLVALLDGDCDEVSSSSGFRLENVSVMQQHLSSADKKGHAVRSEADEHGVAAAYLIVVVMCRSRRRM